VGRGHDGRAGGAWGGRPLTWSDVVDDTEVGLVDLDGYGTGALMNETARELLQMLSDGLRERPTEPPAQAGEDRAPVPQVRVVQQRRGPITVRGDVTELLRGYAPAMAETIRREGRTRGAPPAGGPVGPLAPSRVVSCQSSRGRRWVRIDGYRRSGNRFLLTLVDVTALEQEDPSGDTFDWELADTLAQRLVTAETALDLGRDELGRRLVAEARALIQARIGEHVRRTGGAGPGLMRRQTRWQDDFPPGEPAT